MNFIIIHFLKENGHLRTLTFRVTIFSILFFFIYQYKNSNVINPNINNINSNTVYLNSAHSELSPVLFIIYTQIDKDHPGIKILLCSVVIISLRDPPPQKKNPNIEKIQVIEIV